jgi:hypothetical protein
MDGQKVIARPHIYMQTESEQDAFRKELEGWLKSLDRKQIVEFAIAFALYGPYVTDEFKEWATAYTTGLDPKANRAFEIWKKSKMEIESATESATCYNQRDFQYSCNAAFNCAWYRRFDTDVHAVYHRFLVYLEVTTMPILDVVVPA